MTRNRLRAPRIRPTSTPHPMKKIVWTFGLISGAVMALFMVATLPFVGNHGAADALVGYAGIVAAFLFQALAKRRRNPASAGFPIRLR